MTDSISFTPGEVSAYYSARVPTLSQPNASAWRGPCPIHRGEGENFTVEPGTGRWFCHSQCGRGGDILDIEAALIGGEFPSRKDEVFRLVGRLAPRNGNHGQHPAGQAAAPAAKPTSTGKMQIVETYRYTDRAGHLLFEVLRLAGEDGSKSFRQRRPDGNGGWLWNLEGVERVPYHLSKLLAAQAVFLPEGEKDVATLEAWGLAASCNSGGTGNSHLYADWTNYFQGRHIAILPDNDAPGRKHAAAVAAALLPVAASLRVVELPDLPAKSDVTDWKERGGTLSQFLDICNATEKMDAAALSELRSRWGLAADSQAEPNGNSEPPIAGPALPPGERQRSGSSAASPPKDKRTVREPAARIELPHLVRVNAADLMAEDLPELEPVVDRLLIPGLTILGGRPKSGKSILALQLAMAVATGQPFAGEFEVKKPGRVLYVALEETKTRSQSRINQMLPGGSDFLADVDFVYEVLPLMIGGAAQIEQAIGEKPPVVVVIDTLTALIRNADRRNVDIAKAEYNEIDLLTKLAHRYQAAILLVHHTRKAPGAEATESLMGTTGVSAACDHLWILKRLPEGRASLEVTGRDLEAETYELRLGSHPLGWACTGAGEEVGLSEGRRDIVELLRSEGALKGSDIARRLHKNEVTTRRTLTMMFKANQLNQDDKKRYYIAGCKNGGQEA